MFIEDSKIDEWINEDGYFDLTSNILNLKNQKAQIVFKSREKVVVAGIKEVKRVIEKLSGEVEFYLEDGDIVESGDILISAKGSAKELHQAWKVSQNILEYSCGVATKTKLLVNLAKEINPNIEILTTRKTIPSTKKLALKAILAGGAYPHRLGLGESILIFKEHLNFIGGYEGLIKQLPIIKNRAMEKNIIVEVKDINYLTKLIEAGVDIIQFDKLEPNIIENITKELKSRYREIKFLCAGGIDEKNIKEYANLAIDGIVLTSAYYAKLADIKVEIIPL